MRVLHIGKYYPPFHGGMEYFLGDLLPALIDRDVDAAALVHSRKRDVHAPGFIYQAPSYGQLLFAPVSPLFPMILAKLLKDLKPDLLHLHLPNTSAFWTLAIARARRIPWIIHWHADVEVRSSKPLALAYKAYQPFEQKLLSASRAIIVTSPPYLESSRTLTPWRTKCHMIPLGRNSVGFPEISPNDRLNARQLWRSRKRKVLAVSRMSCYKGLEFLVQATAGIESIQLIIVGANTRAKLQPLVRKLGLEDKIVLTDVQPAGVLHALMDTCDCLCLPSIERTEAFGLVLLEAMYYGKPAIVSDIPGSGVGWVVQNGKTGILVQPKNVQDIARELDNLSREKTKWRTMGANAKIRFNMEFEIGYCADQILQLYTDTLNNLK